MKLRVVGVRHAVYYAPQLVAERLGFLSEEGLDLAFLPGVAAYGLAEEVAAGRADVALGGIWRPALYVAHGQPFVAFGQMNSHCDFQVLGRIGIQEADLHESRVLVTTILAPSPWFALHEWFEHKGVDVGRLRLIPALPIPEARRLFVDGGADVIEIEDVEAVPLLSAGFPVLAHWPRDLGSLPWGVYYSTRTWLSEHRTAAEGLLRALHRAQRWIASNDTSAIAETISPYFTRDGSDKKTLSLPEIELLVELYLRQQMWRTNVEVSREAYDRWGDILVRRGWLEAPVPYESVVDATIAATLGSEGE